MNFFFLNVDAKYLAYLMSVRFPATESCVFEADLSRKETRLQATNPRFDPDLLHSTQIFIHLLPSMLCFCFDIWRCANGSSGRLLVDLVQGGPVSALQGAVGIPAAHLYDFLTVYWPQYARGPTLIRTPAFVQQCFANRSGTQNVTVKGHGTAYRPASTRATTTGNIWGSRGQGRRLGGD